MPLLTPNPNLFAAEPLDRASMKRSDPAWVSAQLANTESVMIPLWQGDPLIADGKAAWLSVAARNEFGDADIVFLGLRGETAHFAIDASHTSQPEQAPFADIGDYIPLREAAASLGPDDVSIIGQGRWLFDWHGRNKHCANCGSTTTISEGGAKRSCDNCETEHFPRTEPVAIVLATHDDACLLGRGPHFPPGFLSALAGFVEAAETPEECAARELYEEAGVTLTDVTYQFSQPWPFPASLMMGYLATAQDRTLTLDPTEIEEAKWIEKEEIKSLLNGAQREDLRLPPQFTIARQLIERWALR